MSVTNKFFNHYNASNEQDLIQDLVDETIFNMGLEVFYIRRSQDNIDFLYNEDSSAYYEHFERLPMYPVNVDGFGGMEGMTFFAHEFQDTASYVVSKKGFGEKFPNIDKPQAGDLLFIPVTNSLLELKYCEEESEFFEKGRNYVYELKVVAFDYSHEDIDAIGYDIEDYLAEIEVYDSENDTESSGGDNDDFDSNQYLEFDPENPFGVR